MIRGVRGLLAVRAEAKGIGFSLTLGPDLPTQLVGDPVRLWQVVSNLADNAIKFTHAGGEAR